MAETVHQEPTTPAAGEQQTERTFTQAEMNAIISDRLTRERSKYADYDDLKAKAAQFDAAQEAGKTELQKANEKAAKLQQQLDDTSRALAAAQAGYDQCADQDLLEYYLYEISALRAKHTYLLRQRREP